MTFHKGPILCCLCWRRVASWRSVFSFPATDTRTLVDGIRMLEATVRRLGCERTAHLGPSSSACSGRGNYFFSALPSMVASAPEPSWIRFGFGCSGLRTRTSRTPLL